MCDQNRSRSVQRWFLIWWLDGSLGKWLAQTIREHHILPFKHSCRCCALAQDGINQLLWKTKGARLIHIIPRPGAGALAWKQDLTIHFGIAVFPTMARMFKERRFPSLTCTRSGLSFY